MSTDATIMLRRNFKHTVRNPVTVFNAVLFPIVLLLMFVFGISSAWVRGLQIECGCFGGGGLKENAASGYALDIVRDIGLVVVSAWLIRFPRTRLSVDSVLFPTTERLDFVDQEATVQD